MNERESMFAARMRLASAEQPRRRLVDARQREHQPLQLRHVERGRGALAGDVRHQHAHARVARAAAGRSSRRPPRPRAGRARRCAARAGVTVALRQQAHLDLARDAQLLLQPLLLRLLAQQVLDAARHHVERLRQLAELVAAVHRDRVREVALAQPLRAARQLVDAAGDRARQQQAQDEGPRSRPPGSTPATAASAFTRTSPMFSGPGESRRTSVVGLEAEQRCGSSSSSCRLPSCRALRGAGERACRRGSAAGAGGAGRRVRASIADVDLHAAASCARPCRPEATNWMPMRCSQGREQARRPRDRRGPGTLAAAPQTAQQRRSSSPFARPARRSRGALHPRGQGRAARRRAAATTRPPRTSA